MLAQLLSKAVHIFFHTFTHLEPFGFTVLLKDILSCGQEDAIIKLTLQLMVYALYHSSHQKRAVYI